MRLKSYINKKTDFVLLIKNAVARKTDNTPFEYMHVLEIKGFDNQKGTAIWGVE